jgi:hypothetical protein
VESDQKAEADRIKKEKHDALVKEMKNKIKNEREQKKQQLLVEKKKEQQEEVERQEKLVEEAKA